MNITVFTQKSGSIALKHRKPRLSKQKQTELIEHLKQIKDILKISDGNTGVCVKKDGFHTAQVVFTSDSTEVSAIIGSRK